MTHTPLVLVADDEEDVRELVCMNLRKAGFNTIEAIDGVEAICIMRQRQPDAVILDVMMPGKDGFEVCEEIRHDDVLKDTPVIILTARGQAGDRISGLEKGADDYVAKPFSPKELVLRVQAVLRRASQSSGSNSALEVGPFHFDLLGIRLSVNGELKDLTPSEFKLLHLLAVHQGEVLERDVLLREVWSYTDTARSRTLDTHVRRLREKLGESGEWVQTVRGHGYEFKQPSAQSS